MVNSFLRPIQHISLLDSAEDELDLEEKEDLEEAAAAYERERRIVVASLLPFLPLIMNSQMHDINVMLDKAYAHTVQALEKKGLYIAPEKVQKDSIALISLIESILVTHQPTWEDFQQLLQALLTSEEKQKVLLEVRKYVLGDDGQPTQLPNLIEAAFPLIRPNWDFSTPDGRYYLRLYHQLLLAGLHSVGRRPTNLAKVKSVTQGSEESPTAFLERLKEAYRRFTPFNTDSPEQRSNVAVAFIWQSAPDIRRKLQRSENLQDYALPDLLKEVEKIFNKRETQEEKEEWLRKLQEEREDKLLKGIAERQRESDRKRGREISRILATVTQSNQKSPDGVGSRSHRRQPVPMDNRKESAPVNRLSPISQPLFVFEWRDSEEGLSGQLTWTRLPQGFKNSPMLFEEVLHQDLAPFQKHHPDLILLQYVDDLLLAAEDPERCIQALGLPDLTKPFELFIDQKRGFAKGVLTQRLGPWRRSTAYLSKKLDPVASGWPPCLRMVAAIAVLTKDAGKLTLWQPLTVLALHAVESIVRQPPDRWLSNARMTHYQSLLLDTDCVHFGPATSLNPATLLPEPDEAVLHNCYQILAETHGTQPDLTDQPQLGAELTWFTDGSSYLHQGERKAGAAVVDGTKAHLQALQLVQKEVWKPLAVAYKEELQHPAVPHSY
ncbi:hypothetical protein STEG23_009654 [Scotinomys teguina]